MQARSILACCRLIADHVDSIYIILVGRQPDEPLRSCHSDILWRPFPNAPLPGTVSRMNNLPNQEVLNLLNRIRDNDDPASRRLYSFYRNQLFRYVRSRIGSRDAVDDIVQETMIAAFKSDRYDGSALYSTWLCAIAHKKIADWGRDMERHPPAPGDGQEPEDSAWGRVADVLEQKETQEFDSALQICIEKLPDGQRVVIRLLLEENTGLGDAAIALAIPEGTVKSRAFHARKALERCMRRVFPHLPKGGGRG